MHLYILDLPDGVVKVGITKDFESRKKTYPKINRYKLFEADDHKAAYLEAFLTYKFNSRTEYIEGQDFDDICDAARYKIETLKSGWFLIKTLDLNVWNCTDNLCLIPALGNYPLHSFMRTQDTKDFVKTIRSNEGGGIVCIAKRGFSGGHYMHPYLAVDYLRNVSADHKVNVYNFLLSPDWKRFTDGMKTSEPLDKVLDLSIGGGQS